MILAEDTVHRDSPILWQEWVPSAVSHRVPVDRHGVSRVWFVTPASSVAVRRETLRPQDAVRKLQGMATREDFAKSVEQSWAQLRKRDSDFPFRK